MVTTTAWTGQMRSAVTPPAVRPISGRVLTVTSVSTTAGDVTARRTAMMAVMKRTVLQLVSACELFVKSFCIMSTFCYKWLVFVFSEKYDKILIKFQDMSRKKRSLVNMYM